MKKRNDRSQANIRIETILHEYSPNFATCISLHTTSPPIIEPDSITIHSSTHSKTLSQGVTHDDRNRPIPKCPSPRRGISQTKPISRPSRLVYPLRCVLHRGYSLSLSVTLSDVYRRALILPTGIGANSKQWVNEEKERLLERWFLSLDDEADFEKFG